MRDGHLPSFAGVETDAWRVVGPANHPSDRRAHGTLVCHRRTGRYMLDVYGSLRSVPQAWARTQDATDNDRR